MQWGSWRALRGLAKLSKISKTKTQKDSDDNREPGPRSGVCLTLKMCAFRMWWPSSMVCCRFSLPSCRENMKARSACPFLGPETQRLVTRPHAAAPQALRWAHCHTTLESWPFSPTTRNGATLPLHQRWPTPSVLQVIGRPSCGVPYLCG